MSEEKDHDLLIRIDENIKNLLTNFAAHEIEDKKKFEDIDKRLKFLEKICYGVGGTIIFVDVLLKFVR